MLHPSLRNKMHAYVDNKTGEPAPLISDELLAIIQQNTDRLNAAIV
jgi:hypothetical protein